MDLINIDNSAPIEEVVGDDFISFGFGIETYRAAVKIVVEAHQGKVWEDTEVGKGSTFYVELPGWG